MGNMHIFLFAQWIGVTWLVSGFLSEGSTLCIAVDSVYLWEELNSRGSYVIISDWNLIFPSLLILLFLANSEERIVSCYFVGLNDFEDGGHN